MNRMVCIVLLCLVLIGMAGCAGTGMLARQSFLVERGQSKEEVLKLMGMPGARQFHEGDEAWMYCATGMGADSFTIVWFYEGATTGVTTYQCHSNGDCGYTWGNCSQGFRHFIRAVRAESVRTIVSKANYMMLSLNERSRREGKQIALKGHMQ